jgi:HPt (histidine-containing phosphotransfer) domain-containing protein
MNDFIAKPINGDDLNSALVRWLPPEMLLNEEQTQADDASPASPDPLLPLRAVRDLDVRTGLRRSSGNPAVDLNILCRFCRDLDRDVADIPAFMADAAWQDYSVRLHALKNMFANFGNQRLSTLALRLEQASIAGDTRTCLTRTQEFCDEMEQFRARLLEARLTDLEDACKKRIAPQELLRSLEQLQRACRERDARAAIAIIRTLQDVACGLPRADALLMELCDLVDLVEYAEALRVCFRLIGMLNGHVAELSGETGD